MKSYIKTAIGAAVAAVIGTGALADKLQDIMDAGKIVVGVKNDYKPWGYLTSDGELVGLEIDLAKDVAERLGVEAELIPVVASNRMEFLQQGQIDLIIATMGDNEKRREVVGMIEPNYYAGGTNVIAPKAANLETWEDLRGKDVCALQGAYYNRRVTELYGPNLVAFAGIPEVTSALQNGSCIAFLYDNTWIESQLSSDDQWAEYEMPFETEDPQAWAIAVPLEDLDTAYGQKMSEIVTDWHKSGYLIERNEANGIAPSPFLQEQHDKLQ
ncbi:transporter substrate-binding domain-containing protein [Roseovarius nanhaiticus]|uniref:transporter substrate-binding domain-containing protein n=1 Tax=Roseovarius nanhaiticus TaxID=573024 RepID=UPI0024905D16|nr:transporter substrate-binding domain-containing protein [Roseovarius nanhaiticus]